MCRYRVFRLRLAPTLSCRRVGYVLSFPAYTSGRQYGHFEIDMYNDKCNVTILNVR